jgi:hypothetical protein
MTLKITQQEQGAIALPGGVVITDITSIAGVDGQATMAASFPVVIASNQSAVAVTPAAQEVHLGQVGGEGITITVNPVLTVAGAYISGDFVGTSATALIFANAARVAGGSGVIKSAMLIDAALQSIACELWLFDTAVTPPNDNAAWTISDGDAATCIGVIPFSTYYASALNSVANGIVPNGGIGFSAVATTIWGCIVTRGAPTYASLNLTLRLSIMQD